MTDTIKAPNFEDLEWLDHGFGLRGSVLPAGIRTLKQIHSSIVLDVESIEKEGDALLSDLAGVRVGVRTADCVPILLVDPSIPVVAAIHAGWRGSAENIVGAAVTEMAARWKTRPENVRAAIGPSIGVCCYEVGPEVANRFERWIPLTKNRHLDLPAVNEIQLRAAGIANIWKSGECTLCMADRFFSFRRDREHAGRMVSFIGLQKHVGRTA
jgi:polyphenol oxidase